MHTSLIIKEKGAIGLTIGVWGRFQGESVGGAGERKGRGERDVIPFQF